MRSPSLAFVVRDYGGFDLNAAGDDLISDECCLGRKAGLSTALRSGREDGFLVTLEEIVEGLVADDAGLDGFLQAGAELAWRQRFEGNGVSENGQRVVECAEEIFAGSDVDAGLSAEGAVDLREQGGGDADVADAAHVGGGEEACHVAEDAAPEREEDGVAIGAGGVHF